MYFDVIFAGFGGQGVMLIGNLLAYAAMESGYMVTYMPVYGVEMRGGTANCTVVVSDRPVGSPIVHNPAAAVVMNQPSLEKFGPSVAQSGKLLVNASLISQADVDELSLSGFDVLMVPAIELAGKIGNDRLANMILLGCVVGASGVVELEAVIDCLEDALDKRYHSMIPINIEALRAGDDFAKR